MLGFTRTSLIAPSSTFNAGDPGSIPGSGRSSGEGIGYPLQYSWASLVAQLVKNRLQCGSPGFDPWVGKKRRAGEGKGCPLQYSGLANSMDCMVRGIPKSWTQLSDFHFHYQIPWKSGPFSQWSAASLGWAQPRSVTPGPHIHAAVLISQWVGMAGASNRQIANDFMSGC